MKVDLLTQLQEDGFSPSVACSQCEHYDNYRESGGRCPARDTGGRSTEDVKVFGPHAIVPQENLERGTDEVIVVDELPSFLETTKLTWKRLMKLRGDFSNPAYKEMREMLWLAGRGKALDLLFALLDELVESHDPDSLDKYCQRYNGSRRPSHVERRSRSRSA